jgi:hypothetical protein
MLGKTGYHRHSFHSVQDTEFWSLSNVEFGLCLSDFFRREMGW